MQAIFNSRERTTNEWKALFLEADPRFEFIGVKEPEGSALAVIDVRWNGEPLARTSVWRVNV
jgi:hypothetical protein